jgi:hypothetical protein
MDLDIITYGCGNQFEKEKFKPIKNRQHTKPIGGLWGSPVNSKYGWWDWGKQNYFGNFKSSFKLKYSGNTLVINSYSDLSKLVWQDNVMKFIYAPDYEAMKKQGIDGIYMTEKGERRTRFALYGYDCECLLIMNMEAIKNDNRNN